MLAGNTIASLSVEDLGLLDAAISAIKPVAGSSPSGKKLCGVCRAFYQFASFSVARQTATPHSPTIARMSAFPADLTSVKYTRDSSYGHIMAPQDWAVVMDEFELGTDAGEIASFVEPYMRFAGR